MRNRKPNRLKGYDYSQDGVYFITVCIQNHIEWFGNIKNEKMVLNKCGGIVEKQWAWLGDQYPYVVLDEHVVMPNHFHGIISILGNGRMDGCVVGNGRDRSLQKIKPLPELIGAFKTTSSKLIHGIGALQFHWQKSFYDHVIRSEKSLQAIREYVVNNSMKWDMDIENVRNCGMDNVAYYDSIIKA